MTNVEPADMRRAIEEKGVPATATTLDDFHASRSLLLARHFGIDAQVFCSEPVPVKWSM